MSRGRTAQQIARMQSEARERELEEELAMAKNGLWALELNGSSFLSREVDDQEAYIESLKIRLADLRRAKSRADDDSDWRKRTT